MNQAPASGPHSAALIDRVKNILLKPAEEWPRIEAEPATIGDIYKSYVFPLAAIPAVAGLIGGFAFGYSAFGITYRPTIASALGSALFQFLASLAAVYIVALVIDWLAPKFDAKPNRLQAFKVAAYSATAGWVAGIFNLIPSLGWLGILGLYGLYLLYLGLVQLMKPPAEKAVVYTVAVVGVCFVAAVLLSFILMPLGAALMGPPNLASEGEISGSLSVPGVGSVDLGKLDAASKQIEAATKQLEAGANGQPVAAIAPNVLQSLLPGTLGGLQRSAVSSSSAGAAGISGSNAEARYGNGDANVTLKITDLAAMGGIAALGTAFNIESSQQTATGYEKTGPVDGRMTTEKWNSETRSGSYGVLVGNRVMVEAEGSNIDGIDALKAAVASVDFGKLEAAAK